MMRSMAAPRDEYLRRLAAWSARAGRDEARALLGNRAIAAVAVIWMALGWASCDRHVLASSWLLAPSIAFVALLKMRQRAVTAKRQADGVVRHYQQGLARIDEQWTDTARGGEQFRDDDHPYATDLDLFGKRSLFGLLCTAHTPIGQATLASWLKTPAALDIVRERQAAVRELAANLDLREALAAHGMAVEERVRERSLLDWAEEKVAPPASTLRAAAFVWGVVTSASVLLLIIDKTIVPLLPILCVVACIVAWLIARRSAEITSGVARGLFHRTQELQLISALIARVERESFMAPSLIALRAALSADGLAASHTIARLAHIAGWYESSRNQFYALLTAPALLGSQFAMALQAWRSRFGPAVARWLRAVGELEALCSLAAYSHEHPDQPFPNLEPQGAAAPFIEGADVGHPLIPSHRRVSNDVHLGPEQRLLLISGSNMSGKSTYLRTLGVNVVLALAGAPVCARRLRLTPLAIGATLRISDSLQEGHSRFYAEIARLKGIVDQAMRSSYTLALLDEILHGTNSHDRFLGAKAVVDALLKTGAMAVVTTHDLALARLADERGAVAANVHFEDRIEDGKLVFDYRMRPGVVTRSNALDLMRLVGLKV